ncbi:MAG: SPFH domain-containing protein [Candidatus Obscuribacterales bacterium]
MDPIAVLMMAVTVVCLFVIAASLGMLYKKAGPSEALIVSGGSPEPRVMIGGGMVVLPLVQSAQKLSLELMSIDVKPPSPYNASDGSQLIIDAVVEARMSGNRDNILDAARNFGNKDIREVRSIIFDAARDCIRRVASNEPKAKLLEDYDYLAGLVYKDLEAEMARLGLEVQAARIREVRETRSSLSTQQNMPAITVQDGNGAHRDGADLSGRIAVVSAPITASKAGEITIGVDRGMKRRILKARSLHLGAPLEIGTAVVITATDAGIATVEPWSVTHTHLPSE